MSNSETPQVRPSIDAPITSSADDDLGRAPVAHEFAESGRSGADTAANSRADSNSGTDGWGFDSSRAREQQR